MPRVQTHPPPMTSSPNPHHRQYGGAPALGPIFTPYGRERASSSSLAFPIRTSQHGGVILTNPSETAYSYSPEHRLRRKTPGGTIDAAYDASPLQATYGPPPFKQLALTTSSTLASHQSPVALRSFTHSSPVADYAQSINRDSYIGTVTPWQTHQPPGHVMLFDARGYPHTWSQGLHFSHDVTNTGVQPILRANEYNVRAFCPPPMPSTTILPFGQPDWSVARCQADEKPTTMHNGFNLDPLSRGSTFQPAADFNLSVPNTWRGYASLEFTDRTNAVDARLRPENGSLGQTSRYGVPSQSGFRQKALAQAQAHYTELLSSTQSLKRSVQMQDSQHTRGFVNPFMYPKPPNPTQGLSLGFEISPRPVTPVDHNLSSAFVGSGPCGQVSFSGDRCVRTQARSNANFGSQWNARFSNVPSTTHPGGPHKVSYLSSATSGNTSVQNASSSLNILRSLCEQSDWKWTEGLLLGGCLLYGLELFNEAFEWFSRISALDPRYVSELRPFPPHRR